jgi:hypothetical protein
MWEARRSAGDAVHSSGVLSPGILNRYVPRSAVADRVPCEWNRQLSMPFVAPSNDPGREHSARARAVAFGSVDLHRQTTALLSTPMRRSQRALTEAAPAAHVSCR